MSHSKRWLNEHHSDKFVKKAIEEGYRSRASYKLLQIQTRDKILKPGQIVVDLGAAPGGWSQVAAQWVGRSGHVFALDILDMPPIANVTFVRGDFTTDDCLARLQKAISYPVDLVISDMAPNTSGMASVDQPRMMLLVEYALDFARSYLKPGGDFLIKVFMGAGFEEYRSELVRDFKKVVSRKPEASRARSKEVYLLARGFKKQSSTS